MGDLVYKELSYQIVGCAQRVHAAMGPGFPEQVYHRALAHELTKSGIPFTCGHTVTACYDGIACGEFRLDLYVDDSIVLELKAVSDLCNDHVAQVLSYLKATGSRLGILLNFGRSRLQTKRIVL
jgi:GxxExxY protein